MARFHHQGLMVAQCFQVLLVNELLKSTIGQDTTEQVRILVQQILYKPDVATGSGGHFEELAVILKGFEKEIQDGMLSAIQSKDRRAAEMLMELMITLISKSAM